MRAVAPAGTAVSAGSVKRVSCSPPRPERTTDAIVARPGAQEREVDVDLDAGGDEAGPCLRNHRNDLRGVAAVDLHDGGARRHGRASLDEHGPHDAGDGRDERTFAPVAARLVGGGGGRVEGGLEHLDRGAALLDLFADGGAGAGEPLGAVEVGAGLR